MRPTFQHPKLAVAIGWKFNHQPGMSTSEGSLTKWPTELWPTNEELAQWVTEYEAYLASPQAKDDELQKFMDSAGGKVAKALAGMLMDKGICTIAELRAKYRSLS